MSSAHTLLWEDYGENLSTENSQFVSRIIVVMQL